MVSEKTACILCSRNCGLVVETENGKFVKIRGDEAHPISKGYICQKAARLDYYQNHEDRLKFPLKKQLDGTFVQVSWDDAQAYCKWAHKRLPTEAEWEFAARGDLKNNIYSWGNEAVDEGKPKANSWQGDFPKTNTLRDKFLKAAPVKSFPANGYGLYDMAGNVWEWCNDWYDYNYYTTVSNGVKNPKGPSKSYDPDDLYAQKHTIRGGSFLCNDGYCSGYRNARRMKETPDTSMEHIGFRCVSDQ